MGRKCLPRRKGKLSAAEIAALEQWVSQGAPDPRATTTRVGGMTPDEVRHWWSFQKVHPSSPPAVDDGDWSRNEIDQFVLAKLRERGLEPAALAERPRICCKPRFDLTGVPPTPEESDAFVRDASPGAWERVVNRLLDSPSFGQRWARHWLDVVRYADFYDANPATRTASCELTGSMAAHRDWVVDSLYADLPFDQFIVHQIAGDLLPNPTGEEVYPTGLVATTFLSNGVWDRGDADKEKIISDMADDNIDTIGKTFLGLTLGCALPRS